ncbi:MAG: response regulator, partial [Leptolyngbya sp. ERB_1_2]
MRLINLLEDLSNRVKYDENCEIHLHNHHVDWKLYIVNNRLLYAADRAYPIRRWDRALNQQGCTWNWSLQAAQLARSIAWECQLLEQGIRQKQLSFIRAKLIIRTIVQECFFELASCSDFDQTIQTIPIKI